MNTNTVNPQARLQAGPPFGTGSRHTALRRPVQDSVVAGVAAGLARYLGVDVMIIRLGRSHGTPPCARRGESGNRPARR